jgi:hypothetical protein
MSFTGRALRLSFRTTTPAQLGNFGNVSLWFRLFQERHFSEIIVHQSVSRLDFVFVIPEDYDDAYDLTV